MNNRLIRLTTLRDEDDIFRSVKHTLSLFFGFLQIGVMVHDHHSGGYHINVLLGVSILSFDMGAGIWP